MAKEKLTHKQELAARRAESKAMLADRKAQQKKQKIALWSTISVAVVAVAVIIVFVVTTSNQNKLDVSNISPNSLSSDGVILTSATNVVKGTGYDLETGKPADSKMLLADSKVPHLEIYLDYDCPHCKEFEDTNAEFLDSLLNDGKATIEYKPMIAIGSNLSISGGNAAACVAEYAPERFNDLHTRLFALTGKQSVSVSKTVKDLGIEGEAGDKVTNCVKSKVFSKWLTTASKNATDRTDAKGAKMVEGTPTIIIDGVKYPYNFTQLKTFITLMLDSNKTVEEVINEQGNK